MRVYAVSNAATRLEDSDMMTFSTEKKRRVKAGVAQPTTSTCMVQEDSNKLLIIDPGAVYRSVEMCFGTPTLDTLLL